MGSLITKATKRRSVASRAGRTTKAKKAVGRKPQRPGRITTKPITKTKAAKSSVRTSKATSAKKSTKRAAKPPAKVQRKPIKSSTARTSQAKRQPAKAKAGSKRGTARHAIKTPLTSHSPRVAARAKVRKSALRRRLPLRPVPAPPPPKKPPSPGTLAAVKAFEAALKQFNRHDFGGAKSSFETVLSKFGDEAEVTARARTYLVICEQRLARTPNVPRNADALYDQGVFELNRGGVVEAIELFEKALKVDSRADHIHYSLAAAFAHRNEPSKALDTLRRAISLRPVNKARARRDLDFATLRNNEAFQLLIGYDFESPEE